MTNLKVWPNVCKPIMNNIHQPVLLNEVLSFVEYRSNFTTYCDFTIGYGGHATAIWKKINQTKSQLIGFDQDLDAYNYCNEHLGITKLQLVHDNFVNFEKYFRQWQLFQIDFALLDLGVSSKQLDDPNRGFSYQHNGPFDMRMNQKQHLPASQYVLKTPLNQLIQIFKHYGEIKNPVHVASQMKKYVKLHGDKTTTLAISELIKANVPVRQLYAKKHPSRLYFQALRIAVNDELNTLSKFLKMIPNYLANNSILCIITFHSLEEKIVKNAFHKLINPVNLTGVPINPLHFSQYELLTNKPITASKSELLTNHRSRSAKLFVLHKKGTIANYVQS